MPQILKTIDQIAREKQRDVLLVTFHKEGISLFNDNFSYEECDERKVLIQWLDENRINFQESFGFAPGAMMMDYWGQIYLDVPYDESNPQYQLLSQYLEHPDGSSKIPDVRLYALKLELAMKYKDDDDPEIGDEWF